MHSPLGALHPNITGPPASLPERRISNHLILSSYLSAFKNNISLESKTNAKWETKPAQTGNSIVAICLKFLHESTLIFFLTLIFYVLLIKMSISSIFSICFYRVLCVIFMYNSYNFSNFPALCGSVCFLIPNCVYFFQFFKSYLACFSNFFFIPLIPTFKTLSVL